MSDENIKPTDPDGEFIEFPTGSDAPPEKPADPPVYESQSGFVKVPLRRGFTEIIPIWDTLRDPTKGIYGTICGGYARYCASPLRKPVAAGDCDIYCKDDAEFEELRGRFDKAGLSTKHENPMSLTYAVPKDKDSPFAYAPIVQLIKPVKEGRIVAAGSTEDILSNFDFTVVRAAILGPTEVLVDADFIHDETHKLLRLKNIHCPVSSALRCMKYGAKGYHIRPMQCLRLFLDWEGRDQGYREKVAEWLKRTEERNLTRKEIEELEALMRID